MRQAVGTVGTGNAMLLKHSASGEVRFFMQDMSSQMLSNLLVYTSQSLGVLNQDSRTGQSCPWCHESQFCSGVFLPQILSPSSSKNLMQQKLVTDSCGDSPGVLCYDSWRCLDLSGGEDGAS